MFRQSNYVRVFIYTDAQVCAHTHIHRIYLWLMECKLIFLGKKKSSFNRHLLLYLKKKERKGIGERVLFI